MITELDALSMGEALWDLEAPRGATFAEALSLRLGPGGAAVNVALALARLGWKTGLAATVGDDALGEALAARVAARGVSTALVRRGPQRTGLVFVERAPRGPRIVGYRQMDEAAPELPDAWSARALLLTGLVPSEAQAASFGAAAREARRKGAMVVIDLNARPRVWRGHAAAPALAWMSEADVVKGSEQDLATMRVGAVELREAMRGSAVLIVTAGTRAARATGSFGEVERAPAPVTDGGAMGAGDAFTAGILDAMLRAGGPIAKGGDAAFWDRALRRGHALARRRVARG